MHLGLFALFRVARIERRTHGDFGLPRVQEQIVRETLCRASRADLTRSPAVFGGSLRQWVRKLTGQADPYLAVKQESNRLALALLPAWRERLRTAANPRLTAVKMAIAGNVIDYGIKGDLTAETIPAELESSFAGPFHGDVAEFSRWRNARPRFCFWRTTPGTGL